MAPLYLLLVICFVGGISGQTDDIIYVDVASGIQESTNFGTPTVVPQSVSSTERRSCVTGNMFYYVDGIDVKNLHASNTIVFSAPADETILSISCFCNLISIAFRQDNGLWIWTFDLDRPYIILEAHSADITQDVLIKYVPGGGRLAIVGLDNVWQILLTDLLTIDQAFSIVPALTGLIDIGCSSNAAGGFDLYVVISGNRIHSGSWDGTASSDVAISASVVPAAATTFVAIAVQNNNLYYLTYSFITPSQWTVISHSITSSGVDTIGTVILGGSSGLIFGGNVHGFHICGTECNAVDCSLPTCDCASATCGTCAGTTNNCQCSNSLLDQCTYSDNAATCEECVPPIDACVFVRNPLALRRDGPPIDVVAVSTVDAVITFERYVDTGRYLAPNLPQNDATIEGTGPPLWHKGISFQVQNAGRGRRFGVYRATFDIVNNNPTYIPAIATESSGFTNTFYAYTAGAGDDVSIEAKFSLPLIRFIDTVRWRYTRVDQTTGTHFPFEVPLCEFDPDRLTCKLSNVMKGTHEGVYEAYRVSRRLRNWHPLIFLFVRRCPLGFWGDECDQPCLVCIHGLCDANCGGCTCYPGWTGTLCNEACSDANLVGDSCTISCSDVFNENENCIGLLISKPAKVPFACRSGLQPPECTEPCEEGFWGPNCLESCDPPCDARTGL